MKSIIAGGALALAFVVAAGLALPGANAAVTHDHRLAATVPDQSAIAKQFAFRTAMRELWEDHVIWTRQVIVSLLDDDPDTNAALTRLLRNQADIGAAIAPFYGDGPGDRLTSLLRDHILIAGTLLTAAKTGDTAGFEAAKTDWYANAHDVAAFLASANPNWTLADLDAAMRTHLDTTLDEAVARLRGDWDADVAAYDRVHDHILRMSDVLADGIIAQFPASFAR